MGVIAACFSESFFLDLAASADGTINRPASIAPAMAVISPGDRRNKGFPTGDGFCLEGLEFIKTGRYCRRSVGDYFRHNRAHRFEQLCLSVLQTSLEKPIPFLSGLWLFARGARTTNIDAMGRELFAVR